MKRYFVYIITNKRNGTLYIGCTSHLIRRIWQHKQREITGFTQKYGLGTLVYYEEHQDVYSMLDREKKLKEWQRKWKLELIEKFNPEWEDLYKQICEGLM